MLIPRETVPELKLPLLGGGEFDIGTDAPENFTLVVFYRGLHCPICVGYLKELERLTPDFAERGVKTVAISSDGEERTAKMKEKVGGEHLRWAHSLPLAKAREWGLAISSKREGSEEPDLFSEPGVYLVRPDGTLYFGAVQTMPFARPSFKDMLGALDFVLKSGYPARGEYTGAV